MIKKKQAKAHIVPITPQSFDKWQQSSRFRGSQFDSEIEYLGEKLNEVIYYLNSILDQQERILPYKVKGKKKKPKDELEVYFNKADKRSKS